jgi:hypothetical protein
VTNMRDPQQRIRELERRNEALENALEVIKLEARKVGVKVADLRRVIGRAVIEVQQRAGQEI